MRAGDYYIELIERNTPDQTLLHTAKALSIQYGRSPDL